MFCRKYLYHLAPSFAYSFSLDTQYAFPLYHSDNNLRSALFRDNKLRLAVRRDKTATWAEWSELRSTRLRGFGVQGPPADVPMGRTNIRDNADASETGGKDRKILQFATKPGDETREYAGLMNAPTERGFAFTKREVYSTLRI